MIPVTDFLIILFSVSAACGLTVWKLNKNWEENKKIRNKKIKQKERAGN